MNEQEIMGVLNEEQKKAVLCTEGPVLILAGAGSGKTRVLVHRIAYLIDVLDVSPARILAITFTNKAAGEMRSRVDNIIGFGSEEIWVSTFHSLCVRILRRYAEELGYTRYFTIYDTDDQLTLMKSIFKRKNVNSQYLKERAVLKRISSAKDELVGPEKFRQLNKDFYGEQVGELYEAYQKELKENNAMDFDDLIMQTVLLFEKNPEILGVYQERFLYMMVDEYQDTNTAQFRLVSLLAGKYRNLCVVGDDDQSIYRFRGANIHNILGFEEVFPDAAVVYLERNYRSTGNILSAANEVIKNNKGRKKKTLWTENEAGGKICLRRFPNGFEEAEYVCGEIAAKTRSGAAHFRDFAVLYRTNAQSRLFEEKLLMANLPYRIVGGVNFYARREIKDVLAYLKTIDNAMDDLQVQRVINVPKRGIGASTIAKIVDFAEEEGVSFYEAACAAARIPGLAKTAVKKVEGFTNLISVLRARAELDSVSELLKQLLELTGYAEELRREDPEAGAERVENVNELISKAVQYEARTETPDLPGFLEEVALVADIDTVEDGDDRILLMTLHAAKGLEFPSVFITGLEEGLFPSAGVGDGYIDPEDLEEERRLCYVGMTRAMKFLTMTYARERMVRGSVQRQNPSRFIREIPRELVESEGEALRGGPMKKPELQGFGLSGEALLSALAAPAKNRAPSKPKPFTNPYRQVSLPRNTGEKVEPDYKVGDQVRHVKFGVGNVLEIKDGGKDYLVTVDFSAWGVKKMYASVARLEKV